MINHPHHSGILQFKSLKPFQNLSHFTTTRMGGCSGGTYGSFNLGYYSGDMEEHVRKNRQLLCGTLGLGEHALYVPRQVHGAEVGLVEGSVLSTDAVHRAELLQGKDALLTSQKGICIAVSTADCVPILLYAKDTQVVGAVHAGWRGTCGRILQTTLQAMFNRYNCTPQEIHAVIGPSISKVAFEVGNEVYEAFHANGFKMDSIADKHPKTGKYHIDLWEANHSQLLELGVPVEQIQLTGACTYTHFDIYFSARRLGETSGRMLTGICMK